MVNAISKTIKKNVSYWWLFLLTGLVLIGIGIWMFVSPAQAYVTLSILFAVSMVVTGIFETIFALTARKSFDGWAGHSQVEYLIL